MKDFAFLTAWVNLSRSGSWILIRFTVFVDDTQFVVCDVGQTCRALHAPFL